MENVISIITLVFVGLIVMTLITQFLARNMD